MVEYDLFDRVANRFIASGLQGELPIPGDRVKIRYGKYVGDAPFEGVRRYEVWEGVYEVHHRVHEFDGLHTCKQSGVIHSQLDDRTDDPNVDRYAVYVTVVYEVKKQDAP